MKFSILSMVTLAISAAASPLATRGTPTSIDQAIEQVGEVSESGDVITLLKGAISSVKGHTTAINSTVSQADSGDVTKDAASDELLAPIEGLRLDLSKLVNSLTSKAGIPVAKGDVDRVLALVNILLEELLATVKYLVTVLGLRAPLVSLLHAVFTLVANLLSVLVRLLAGLLPALLGGLTPLLSALGNGLLAPILGPVVDLVNSLAGL